MPFSTKGIYGIEPNAKSAPTQSQIDLQGLFAQNFIQTPDGRWFLPFKNTFEATKYNQSPAERGITDPATIAEMGPYSAYSFYNPGTGETSNYSSSEDYVNRNPMGWTVTGSGYALNPTAGSTAGTYNGELGYYVDPNSISGAQPANVGGKPNENGTWQILSLLAPAAGGIFGAAGAEGAGAGAGAGAGGSGAEAVPIAASGAESTAAGEGLDIWGNSMAAGGGSELAGSELTPASDPALTAAPVTGESAPFGESAPLDSTVPVGEPVPPDTLPAVGSPAFEGSTGQSFTSGGGGGLGGGGDDFGPPVAAGSTPSASNTEFDAAISSGQEQPGGGGNFLTQDTLNKALKYGPLALGALNAVKGRSDSKRYSNEMKDVGAPQRDIGNQLVNQYKSGQMNSADKFAIDQWEQSAIARARAYYAKAGISDSSMAQGAENEIHAKAAAMRQEALNNVLQMGLNALNIVDKYQAAAIQAEMQGDQATMRQIQDFLNSYGNWLRILPALQGSGSGASAPAGG